MAQDVRESDWRVFRELRQIALDRFCKRVLEEVNRHSGNASRSHHERYRDVYRLLRERDEELARAFDDPRRSHMISQLAAIYSRDLLNPEEFARFSPETRETIESLVKELLR